MDILQAIKEAPEWVALIIALLWNYAQKQQIDHLTERVERISDRTDSVKDSLIGKLTKTDIGEV